MSRYAPKFVVWRDYVRPEHGVTLNGRPQQSSFSLSSVETVTTLVPFVMNDTMSHMVLFYCVQRKSVCSDITTQI